MGLPEPWINGIHQCAEQNGNVSEVWLFGSYERGDATNESDVDLAITLTPASGNHNWALGNANALLGMWQRELEEIVGRHVSLEIMPFELLWRRDGSA
jgi:predicted nucleotidyltransferase